MKTYLRQRVEALFKAHDSTILATCGEAGPQISRIAYRVHEMTLALFVPHSSDHLFNLETQQTLSLLTPSWKLVGRGETASLTPVKPPYTWQTVILVKPCRLHILSDDGQNTIETIDF